MSELFDNLPESKSPRLLWMERHGVEIGGPNIEDEMFAVAKDRNGVEQHGYGHDEQSAIAALALRCGWKLWNEEGGAK